MNLGFTRDELVITVVVACALLGSYGWLTDSYTDYMMGFGAMAGALIVIAIDYRFADSPESGANSSEEQ